MTPNQRRAAELGVTTGGAAAIAVAVMMATRPVAAPVLLPIALTAQSMPASPAHAGDGYSSVRVVSCGDSHVAKVAGDDNRGTITLGPGAGAGCTLLFSRPWGGTPTCSVTGGTPAKLNTTDLVIVDAGPQLVYECKEQP